MRTGLHRSFDIDCIQQKRVIISGKEERTLWATKHIWYSKTERSSAANPSAAAGEVTAEVVFTTGMTGYLETLTDKSYFGQIVVQTFPLIGNYGVIPSDFEGKIIGPCGYIVKEWCQSPSNFRSEGDLDTFFKERGVTAFAASIHVPSQRSSAKAVS